MGRGGWEGTGGNAEAQLGRELFDMSGRPQGEMSSGRRKWGSEFIGKVTATGTNLEVISFRIFKSMGTDEITQEEGSRETLDQAQRDPSNPPGASVCLRLRGAPGPRAAPGLHGRPAPMRSSPCGGLQGAPQLVRQEEKKEVGRMGEEGAGSREWPPAWPPCVQELEGTEGGRHHR